VSRAPGGFASYKSTLSPSGGAGTVPDLGTDNSYACQGGCGPTVLGVLVGHLFFVIQVLSGDGLTQATRFMKLILGRL